MYQLVDGILFQQEGEEYLIYNQDEYLGKVDYYVYELLQLCQNQTSLDQIIKNFMKIHSDVSEGYLQSNIPKVLDYLSAFRVVDKNPNS